MRRNSRRNAGASVSNAIIAAGTPTAPTGTVTSLTPTSNVAQPSLVSTSSHLTQRSIRSIDDLVAERIADKLPPFSATTTAEFMNWSFLVINHFSLLPAFSEEVLSKPREQLSFGTASPDVVDFMYKYVWERLFPIISQVPGIQMRVRRVPRLHISQLWQVFRDKFCPQTQIELVHRSRSFQDLKQGTATIKQFTDKVLTEWDLLLFMGITKSEDEVKNTIMMGLTDRDAQQYAFRFLQLNIDTFVNEVNQYDVLLAIQTQSTTSNTRPVAS